MDSQVQLLRLEAELERRRRKEIQSLVPLDTPTYDQDVILLSNGGINHDDYDFNNHEYINAHIDHRHHDGMDTIQTHNNSNNIQRKKSKRGSLRLVRRWFSLSKKASSSSDSAALDRDNNKEQRDNMITTKSSASKKNKKPHTISFEQYQQDKAILVGQGLNRLSNQNIARALGAGGLASVVFTPPPSPATFINTTMQQGNYDDSQITSTSASQQQQQQHHQKRDSGVSLFSKSTSKKEYQQQQLPSSQLSQNSSFVSARYPKMIHLKALRGAAIQALSSDFSLGEESVYYCSSDLPNCCCPR